MHSLNALQGNLAALSLVSLMNVTWESGDTFYTQKFFPVLRHIPV